MKPTKFILFLALAGLVATGCKKTLELSPEDYFAELNFWKTEAQASNFMVGMHSQLRGSQFMLVRLGEMRSGIYSNKDVQNTSLNELPIIEQRIEETSAGVGNWGGFYNPILQANIFIQKMNESDLITGPRKNTLLAQAHAMRAYYYFILLRTYGGVPIWLAPDVINEKPDQVKLRRARATEAEVLKVIKDDVNTALSLFATGSPATDKYQWNNNAALMLKGEVYLWSAKVYGTTADLAEAKTALTAVTGTSLLPNFANVFAYNQKRNNEIIFAIPYRVGEAEHSTVSFFTYSTFNFDGQHYKDSTASAGVGNFLTDPLNIAATNIMQIIQRYRYTFEHFQSYQLADTRRNATFYDYYKVNTAVTPRVPTVRNTALVKFLGTIDANKRYFADDFPIYREADRLLMLAEIVNAEGGDPTEYIKPIRDRAFGGAANDPTPFVNGSKDANELAIYAERSKEFVHEGKLWYDLRRMKYGNEPLVFISPNHPYGVLDKTTQAHKILWPIEPAIWTNDPLVDQTPGYLTSKPK